MWSMTNETTYGMHESWLSKSGKKCPTEGGKTPGTREDTENRERRKHGKPTKETGTRRRKHGKPQKEPGTPNRNPQGTRRRPRGNQRILNDSSQRNECETCQYESTQMATINIWCDCNRADHAQLHGVSDMRTCTAWYLMHVRCQCFNEATGRSTNNYTNSKNHYETHDVKRTHGQCERSAKLHFYQLHKTSMKTI